MSIPDDALLAARRDAMAPKWSVEHTIENPNKR